MWGLGMLGAGPAGLQHCGMDGMQSHMHIILPGEAASHCGVAVLPCLEQRTAVSSSSSSCGCAEPEGCEDGWSGHRGARRLQRAVDLRCPRHLPPVRPHHSCSAGAGLSTSSRLNCALYSTCSWFQGKRWFCFDAAAAPRSWAGCKPCSKIVFCHMLHREEEVVNLIMSAGSSDQVSAHPGRPCLASVTSGSPTATIPQSSSSRHLRTAAT